MLYKKEHQNISPYIILAIAVFLAALIFVGVIVYRGAKAIEERQLITRAETLALSLDSRDIYFLAGNASDTNNPFYKSLKDRFEKLRAINSDMRFLYLAGKRLSTVEGAKKEEIFLYLDSEPEGSPDYSPPGQSYAEASPTFHEVFDIGQSRFEGPLRDRWGNWISAFVPFRDPKTGDVIAVLGADVQVYEYYKHIILSAAFPVLSVAIFFLLFLFGYFRYEKEKEMLFLKAEFLSIASHDLRSPISGVLWAIQALAKDADIQKDPSKKETLENIERALRRVLDSVRDILDSEHLIGSSSGVSARNVDATATLREIIESLAFSANERNIAIVFEQNFPKTLPVKAASDGLRHVLSNILSNALKYSHPGGTVIIHYSDEADTAVISVEDNGVGIPEGDQKRIFSKYFRGSNAGQTEQKGVGLGLYFTKRLVESFGGRIWFVSQENVGTKFYVEIQKYNG